MALLVLVSSPASIHAMEFDFDRQFDIGVVERSFSSRRESEPSDPGAGLDFSTNATYVQVSPALLVAGRAPSSELSLRLGVDYVAPVNDEPSLMSPAVDGIFRLGPRRLPLGVVLSFTSEGVEIGNAATALPRDDGDAPEAAVRRSTLADRTVIRHSASIEPSVRLPLGSRLEAYSRLRAQWTFWDDSRLVNSDERTLALGVESVFDAFEVQTRLEGSVSRLALDNGQFIDIEDAFVSATVPVGSTVRLEALTGVERVTTNATGAGVDVDVDEVDGSDPPVGRDVTENGSRWALGVRWQPSVRTTVVLGYGRRFFGDSPRLSVEHRSRRSTLTLELSRDVVRAGARVADSSGTTEFGEVDSPSGPSAGDPPRDGFSDTALEDPSNEIRTQRRLGLAYLLRGRLSVFGLAGRWSESLDGSSRSTADRFTVEASFERRLSARWSWRLAGSHSELRLSDRGEDDERRVELFLRYDSRTAGQAGPESI